MIAAELITEIAQVLEDKKVMFGEILGLAPELMKVPTFVASMPYAIDEIKAGISPEYFAEIQKAVSEKIQLKNDKAEVITKAVVNWIVLTAALTVEIKQSIS